MNLDIWGPLKKLSICLVCIAALVKKNWGFWKTWEFKAHARTNQSHRQTQMFVWCDMSVGTCLESFGRIQIVKSLSKFDEVWSVFPCFQQGWLKNTAHTCSVCWSMPVKYIDVCSALKFSGVDKKHASDQISRRYCYFYSVENRERGRQTGI